MITKNENEKTHGYGMATPNETTDESSGDDFAYYVGEIKSVLNDARITTANKQRVKNAVVILGDRYGTTLSTKYMRGLVSGKDAQTRTNIVGKAIAGLNKTTATRFYKEFDGTQTTYTREVLTNITA